MSWKVVSIAPPGGETKIKNSSLYKERGMTEMAAEMQEELNKLNDENYVVQVVSVQGGGFLLIGYRKHDEQDDKQDVKFSCSKSEEFFDAVLEACRAVPPWEYVNACRTLVLSFMNASTREEVASVLGDCDTVITAHTREGGACYVARVLQQVKQILQKETQYALS